MGDYFFIIHSNDKIGSQPQCYESKKVIGNILFRDNIGKHIFLMKNKQGVKKISDDYVWNFFFYFLEQNLDSFVFPDETKFQSFNISKSFYGLLDFKYLRLFIAKNKLQSNFLFFILETICEKFHEIDKCRIPLYSEPVQMNNSKDKPTILRKSYLFEPIKTSEVYQYEKYFSCALLIKNVYKNFQKLIQSGYCINSLPIGYIVLLDKEFINNITSKFRIELFIKEKHEDCSSDMYLFNGAWHEIKWASICNIENFNSKYVDIVCILLKHEKFHTPDFIGSILIGFRNHASEIPQKLKMCLHNAIIKCSDAVRFCEVGCSLAEAIELVYFIGMKSTDTNIIDSILPNNLTNDLTSQFVCDPDRAEYCVIILGEIHPTSKLLTAIKEKAPSYIASFLAQKYGSIDEKEYQGLKLSVASFFSTLNSLAIP